MFYSSASGLKMTVSVKLLNALVALLALSAGLVHLQKSPLMCFYSDSNCETSLLDLNCHFLPISPCATLTAATPVYIEASELDSNNESQLSYDYFACGGSVTQSVSVCETFKEDPQYYFKRGYSAGWYKDEHCTEVDDSISTPQINASCTTFGKYSFQENNDPSKVTLVEGVNCSPTPSTLQLGTFCTTIEA
jgi:hypothetical protein